MINHSIYLSLYMIEYLKANICLRQFKFMYILDFLGKLRAIVNKEIYDNSNVYSICVYIWHGKDKSMNHSTIL